MKTNNINSKQCTSTDIKDFLKARNNIKVRQNTQKPEHIISLEEHLKWWSNSFIKKFSVAYNNKVIGYHWIKVNLDERGKFITTGWFLSDYSLDPLKLSFEILKMQIKILNKEFFGMSWVSIHNKNNKFVEKLNFKVGFNEPSDLAKARALKYLSSKNDNYRILEMFI